MENFSFEFTNGKIKKLECNKNFDKHLIRFVLTLIKLNQK